MAQEAFRNEQWQHRYDEHIAPINQMVDQLRCDPRIESPWVPYVAPMYGGIKARLLSLLRDPGPKTQDEDGSGFLSMENEDPTAEALCTLFSGANIGATEIVPWNAYPWYINRNPTTAELKAGVEPLKQLLDLLPDLKVVMIHGGSARNGWKHLTRAHPSLIAERKLHVIPTYHTSRQAFWHRDPGVREARKKHLQNSFQESARILQSS